MLAELRAPVPLPGLPVTDLATLPVGTPELWLQRRAHWRFERQPVGPPAVGAGIS